jgi:hypothetical protein
MRSFNDLCICSVVVKWYLHKMNIEVHILADLFPTHTY